MSSPTTPDMARLMALLERLETQHSLPTLTADVAETFAETADESLVLLIDDPKRAPEVWDVAVVLPEVLKTLRCPPITGVADADASRQLAERYEVRRFPALLYRRKGAYVGVIQGMLDWDSFGPAIDRLAKAPAQRAPGIGIPVRRADESGKGCGGVTA